MNGYQLVVDTWESGGEIDEQVYKDNNIAALIIRLNDMNGGHHMDTGFEKQWAEAKAKGLLIAPYFVYNPWKKGQANFDWLIAHCPEDANTVLVDIEVSKPFYSKSAYAAQVDYFMKLVKEKWGTKTIYTAEWFLNRLDFWPEDADYWWAQYPYVLHPEKTTRKTWDEVRKIIDDNNFREPFNVEKIPGTYKMWQCTGDRLVCPGNDRYIDISIFPGTYKELTAFLGYQEVPDPDPDPDPDPPTGDEKMIAEAIDRLTAAVLGTGKDIVDAIEDVTIPTKPDTDPDTDTPLNWSDPLVRTNPDNYPRRWELDSTANNDVNVPFFRNNDITDSKIILWDGVIVKEHLPPSKYWGDDISELMNITNEFAWVRGFYVEKPANGKWFHMPTGFITTAGKPCDNWYGGAFVRREDLKAA